MDTPTIAATDWDEWLEALCTHLTFLQEEGQSHVAVDPKHVAAWRTASSTTTAASPGTAVPPPKVAAAPSSPAPMEEGEDMGSLEAIAQRVASCQLCGLCKTRTRTVPGQGAPRPELMFIGEGPGADEDQQGLAFVGRAGKLLTKIIEAMGFQRDEVWIGNIVKCRPPNNRPPTPEEMNACLPYLKAQIALLQPKVIVCLGDTAVKGLFNPQATISRLRGQWMNFEGIDTMPTYPPAYLLRNPSAKRDVWADMKAVLERLGRSA